MTSIGPRIAIAGEREYRQAIRSIREDTRLLGSEMQKTTATFGSNEKSMEALRAKSAQLQNQIGGYSKIVESARQGMDKSQKSADNLGKEIEGLRGKLSSAEKVLEKMKSTSSTTDKELKAQEKTVSDLGKELKTAEGDYARINRTTKQWETALNQNEAKLIANQKQLEANEKAMKDYGKAQIDAAKNSEEHKKAAENLKKTLDILKVAALAVVSAIAMSGKAAIDFEDAFVGVRKTVDATEEELQGLSDGIREMSKDIPVAANDLAVIAENAGRLGIETKNILGFTRTIADLGVATNLTGEEAAQTLAKFANITQMSQSEFGNLGSAIVDLGNNFATTEADIAAMSMRLAGAGSQAGMSEADILGLATALSSVGMEAQAGGSAFSKVITNINVAVQTSAEELADYAKVAGMTVDEFSKLFNQNSAQAITRFIEGLGNAGKESVLILENMGLTEVRLRDALLRAAGAGDTMKTAIETSNQAWAENTALMTEAETKYATTASQLKILKNNIVDAGIEIGNGLLPQIQDLAQKVKDADLQPIVKSLQWIINNSKGTISAAVGIGAGMAAWNVAKTIHSVVAAMKVWKGAMDAAKVSQMGLNAAMAANPIGLVVTLIATLTAGLLTYSLMADKAKSASAELYEEIKALGDEVDTLKGKTEDLTTTFDVQADEAKNLTDELYNLEEQLQDSTLTEEKAEEIKNRMHDIMRQLRNIIPDLVIELDRETNRLTVQRGEVESLIDSYIRLAKAKAAQNLLEEAEEKALRARVELKKAEEGRAGAQWNIDYLTPRVTGARWGETVEQSDLELLQTETVALKEWTKALEDGGDNVYAFEKEVATLKKVIEETGIEFSDLEKEVKKIEGGLEGAGEEGEGAGRRISTGAKTASKATKDASKEMQDEFNKRQRNLKFNLDMGYITEQRYYEGLEHLRDEYFAEGTDEWQRYTLEIHNHQKQMFENTKKEAEEIFKSITDSMKTELDEVARLQSNFESKIRGYTPLFSSQTVTIKNWDKGESLQFEKNTLSDFRESLEKFAQFTTLLNKVKERGLSRVLFNEIMNLSIDDGIKFMELLLNSSDTDYDLYMSSYNAIQAISKSLPDYVYKDEVQRVADKYSGAFSDVFGGLTSEYFDIGSSYAQAMGEGFTEQFKYVFAAMKQDIENKLQSISTGVNLQRLGQAQTSSPVNITSNVNVTGGNLNTVTSQAVERVFKVLKLKGVL